MEDKMKDIYKGEIIGAWEDEENVFMNFYPNSCILVFPSEYWSEVRKELREMVKGQITVLKDVKKRKKKSGK